jgi:Flp pilus assembly protein TadG
MKRILKNQSGAVLITFAILLMVLLGFVALGTEAGRWYLVRSELSKAVDAAALTGAQNISNPFVTVDTIAKQVGAENFSAGQFGTPSTDPGSVSFTTTSPQSNEVQVVGNVSAVAILARLFGIGLIPMSSSGVAQKNKVEIMMVLDRSGSMAGQPIADLENAATTFLSFFQETQDQDKMGLVSFAGGVTVDHPLSINFVTDMTAKISAMTAIGATNAEDAIAQAGGGFTDQTGVPGSQRIQQYLIFFTDGRPTAFRGWFRSNGIDYDAVVMDAGYSLDNQCYTVWNYMGYTNSENYYPISTLPPTPTGDGNPLLSSRCGSSSLNTEWYILGDSKYGKGIPLPGYNPTSCSIPTSVLASYVCNTAKSMAENNALALKNKGIKIYTIGLGYGVDQDFLGQVASGSAYAYYTPTSDQLQAIFNAIAKEIKLRLVS